MAPCCKQVSFVLPRQAAQKDHILNLKILGSRVALSTEELLNVGGGWVEAWGELRRGHVCGFVVRRSVDLSLGMVALRKSRKPNLEVAKEIVLVRDSILNSWQALLF